jgi:hypothetical protein
MEIVKLILALMLGAIVFIFTAFNKSEDKNFKEFILRKENYISAFLNIMSGMILIFSYLDDPTILSFMGISKLTFLTTAILGFSAHGLFQSAVDSTSKKAKTKMGINSK